MVLLEIKKPVYSILIIVTLLGSVLISYTEYHIDLSSHGNSNTYGDSTSNNCAFESCNISEKVRTRVETRGRWSDDFQGASKISEKDNVTISKGGVELEWAEPDPDSSTVALWHMNEGSGSTIKDASGNQNDGTINGATWVSGRFGNALKFDGSHDYIDVGTDSSLDLHQTFTVSAWIKADTLKNYAGIVTKVRSDRRGSPYSYMLICHNDGTIGAYDGSTWHFSSNAGITTGNWYHVVWVLTGGNIYYYVNGQSCSSNSFTYTDTAAHKVFIGSWYSRSTNYDFNGIIDEVAISNVARSASEIAVYARVDSGSLISKPIKHALNTSWEFLTIDKTEPANTQIKVTILDNDGYPIQGFEDLTTTSIALSSLEHTKYMTIRLKATLTGPKSATPTLHCWSVNWSNKPPTVLDLSTGSQTVFRGGSVSLYANFSDREELEDYLTPVFSYKYSDDPDFPDYWHTGGYFANESKYIHQSWTIKFSPDVNARIGLYDLRVMCKDFGLSSSWFVKYNATIVLNNPPTAPGLNMRPADPRSIDDLTCEIIKISVDEIDPAPPEIIFYTYRWYKDGDLQEALTITNSTLLKSSISSSNTLRDEIWKCVVTPTDGLGEGPSTEVEVKILNSPPTVKKPVLYVNIEEDEYDDKTVNLLKVFEDPDEDSLEFKSTGEVHITVELDQETGAVVFTPEKDWYGEELVTFHGSDSYSETMINITVKVRSVNDPPIVKRLGDKMVDPKYDPKHDAPLEFVLYEGLWFNITIIGYDVDDTTLKFQTDIIKVFGADIALENYKLKSTDELSAMLSFKPSNEMVGRVRINITVTDKGSAKIVVPVLFIIKNSNDAPAVPDISEPRGGSTFQSKTPITFTCFCSDPDEIHGDKLNYTWVSNITGAIGYGSSFKTTIPYGGAHKITVNVRDSSDENSSASVTITVVGPAKPPPRPERYVNETSKEPSESGLKGITVAISVVIIILVVLVIVFVIVRKRKSEEESEEEDEEVEEGVERGTGEEDGFEDEDIVPDRPTGPIDRYDSRSRTRAYPPPSRPTRPHRPIPSRSGTGPLRATYTHTYTDPQPSSSSYGAHGPSRLPPSERPYTPQFPAGSREFMETQRSWAQDASEYPLDRSYKPEYHPPPQLPTTTRSPTAQPRTTQPPITRPPTFQPPTTQLPTTQPPTTQLPPSSRLPPPSSRLLSPPTLSTPASSTSHVSLAQQGIAQPQTMPIRPMAQKCPVCGTNLVRSELGMVQCPMCKRSQW